MYSILERSYTAEALLVNDIISNDFVQERLAPIKQFKGVTLINLWVRKL
jgi:hypothetical protein